MEVKSTLYFVEGRCEEVLVRALIKDFHLLPSGRIKILNITQNRFPRSLLFSLKPNTSITFIFDTDAGKPQLVKETIATIESSTYGVEIITVPQCRNLEEELLYTCDIREIKQITKSKSNSDFKPDFIHASNIKQLLESCHFDFERLWSREATKEWEMIRKGNIKNSKRTKSCKQTSLLNKTKPL